MPKPHEAMISARVGLKDRQYALLATKDLPVLAGKYPVRTELNGDRSIVGSGGGKGEAFSAQDYAALEASGATFLTEDAAYELVNVTEWDLWNVEGP